jgi:hypothetical protein
MGGNMSERSDEAAAKAIADALNYMGNNPEVIADVLANRTHRTLQQSFMRVVVAFIEAEAKNVDEYKHDLRNEATVKLCEHIAKSSFTDDEGFRMKHLPFI